FAKRFKNANGERINFFAGRASRHPGAQFTLALFVFQDRWQKTITQYREERRVAEKARHIDQQIIEERFNFLFVVAQETRVLAKLRHPMQGHAPLDPSVESFELVAGEIDAHLLFERKKDAAQIVRLLVIQFGCSLVIARD